MKKLLLSSLFIGLVTSGYIFAADKPSKANDVDFFATVNGIPLTSGLLDLNVKAALAQGQKDSPELKNALKDELINRELLTQESIRQGLDKDIDFRDQISQHLTMLSERKDDRTK